MSKESGKGPHYYGGQAVLEGVMMRGARTWAVAVRRPSGDIYVERHPVSDFPERYPIFRRPMFRGMFGLVDALRIGTRALTVSVNQSVEEEEQLSGRELGGSLVMALLLFIGVFIVLPNAGLAFVHDRMANEVAYHVLEGFVRMAIFLAYLFGISLIGDIRRVFQYHGAEHKTIAAWEHDEPLDPAVVDRYSTLHVRCGTNFLLMVMLVAIVVYSVAGAVVPTPEGGLLVVATYHILLRVALLPVVAGLAYEGLRLGAGRDNLFVQALMKPGLWLQLITTKPPTQDQIEVAIRAFEAVVPTADLAGRAQQGLDSQIVWGPDEVPAGEYGMPAEVTGEPIESPHLPPEDPGAGEGGEPGTGGRAAAQGSTAAEADDAEDARSSHR